MASTSIPPQASIECCNPDCKKPFILMMPPPEIVNKMTISMVVWAHPEVQCCPHCGTAHQMAIQKIGDIQIAWSPVQTPKDASMISLAPAGVRLPPPPSSSRKS